MRVLLVVILFPFILSDQLICQEVQSTPPIKLILKCSGCGDSTEFTCEPIDENGNLTFIFSFKTKNDLPSNVFLSTFINGTKTSPFNYEVNSSLTIDNLNCQYYYHEIKITLPFSCENGSALELSFGLETYDFLQNKYSPLNLEYPDIFNNDCEDIIYLIEDNYITVNTIACCTESDHSESTEDRNSRHFLNQFSIYPTITNSIINIRTSINNSSVRLYNLSGKLIDNRVLNTGLQFIDMSSLPLGIYLIEIIDNNKNRIIIKKVIKGV